MPPVSFRFTETRTTRLPALSSRSAISLHQSSSTPTIAVPLVRHAGDQPLLHCRVIFHRAVAVEMILAEIDQDADRRIERRREIDLIGRAFDDVNAQRLTAASGGCSDRIAVPILPPSCASMPADLTRCAISAVVVDLPLVPVMATNGAAGRVARPLAAEQLDIADDLDAGVARELDHPMRLADASAARRARAPARRSCVQSTLRRSAVGMPAALALATLPSVSS